MSSPASTEPIASASRALQVVFFGPKDSGKTQLLKACLRLASEAEPLDRADTPTLPSYHLEWGDDENREVFRILDCDGAAADELLSRVRQVDWQTERQQLVQAIRQADVLAVVVDAKLSLDQLRFLFQDFLVALEEARCYGREVGGLPVVLTLTKADALLVAHEAPGSWLTRLEEKKRLFLQAFQELIGAEVPDPTEDTRYLPFGTLDLHVQATALHCPNRPDWLTYLDQSGTFGVQEFLDLTTSAAQNYRNRLDAGKKRLRWTISATSGLLLSFLSLLLLLLATGGFSMRNLLADRVEALRRQEPGTAVRLADQHLNRNLKEWQSIRENEQFDRLPSELQEFVQVRLAEYQAYRDYRTRFLPPRLGPAEVQSREQVQQLRDDLQLQLKPPSAYAEAWKETAAVRLLHKWEADLLLLTEAEGLLHDWFRSLIRRGNQLLLAEQSPDFRWRTQVKQLLDEAATPPNQRGEEMSKSPSVPVLRGRRLKFESAYRFDRVQAAEKDWFGTRDRLIHLRDLCDVIGLTSGQGVPPPLLDLPEPRVNNVGSQGLGTERLTALRVAYPPISAATPDLPEWGIAQYPEPIRKALAIRLTNIRDTALRHLRGLLLQQLGEESPERWRELARSSLVDPDIKNWGRLLKQLSSWIDPAASLDPVEEAAAFFRQNLWPVQVQQWSLAISDDLLDPRAIPKAALQLKHTSNGQQKVYAFQVVGGEPKRDRPFSIYTLRSVGPGVQFNYLPGDELTAELVLQSGPAEYKLIWAAPRSKWFQLDALQQPPRLEKLGPIPAPRLAPDVKLTPTPSEGWPTVPILLPERR